MANALQSAATHGVSPRFRHSRPAASAPAGVIALPTRIEPKREEPPIVVRPPEPRFAARARAEQQAAGKNLAHRLQQRLPVDPDQQRKKKRALEPLKKKTSDALDEVAPNVIRAVDASSSRSDVREALEVLQAHVANRTLTYEELAIVIARRIVAENTLALLELPAALDAVMPDVLARPLVAAVRKELGRSETAFDHRENGVRISFDELCAMLGDVRDDRPSIDLTVQKINARIALAGADYTVLDLDPKIEATPIGRRILRRLPMVAAALAEAGLDLGRIMLVVRAGSLAPYARILDIARLHFRAVACPGMQPDVLDSVSRGSSAASQI